MAAGNYDIYIERGSDWGLTFTYKNSEGVAINLTGCTVESEIKETADINAVVLLQITAVVTTPSEGVIDLSLTKVQTSLLPATGPNFKYLKNLAYDVILTLSTGKAIRIMNGVVNVSPGVTS